MHEAGTDRVTELGSDARELLTLTAWEQLTPAEIAAMIGDAPGSVRVRLHRARGQLCTELARLGIECGDDEITFVATRSNAR